MIEKEIIDLCCGWRMFWYDKKNPLVHFMDIRTLPKGSIQARQSFSIEPNEVGDYRDIKHPDWSFKIVVMDPPHLKKLWEKSRMAMKYWKLSKEWKEDLLKWFTEGMRILKEHGILIFKWNDYEIPLGDVIKLFPVKPMIGQRTGKNNSTVWLIYLKI